MIGQKLPVNSDQISLNRRSLRVIIGSYYFLSCFLVVAQLFINCSKTTQIPPCKLPFYPQATFKTVLVLFWIRVSTPFFGQTVIYVKISMTTWPPQKTLHLEGLFNMTHHIFYPKPENLPFSKSFWPCSSILVVWRICNMNHTLKCLDVFNRFWIFASWLKLKSVGTFQIIFFFIFGATSLFQKRTARCLSFAKCASFGYYVDWGIDHISIENFKLKFVRNFSASYLLITLERPDIFKNWQQGVYLSLHAVL